MKVHGLSLLILSTIFAQGVVAQNCKQPPTTTSINKNFYRAYQKLAVTKQSSDSGLNVAVPIDGVPLAFGMSSSDKSSAEDLTTLTTDEATQIVQKELADQKVAIIAWCGYEMCQQNGNEMAVQALTGVCSLANGDSIGVDTQYSVRPISGQVVFDVDGSRSTTLWLRLPSQSGLHAEATAMISFKSDNVSIAYPQGSSQNSIILDSNAPTQLTATFQRPQELSDAFIDFNLAGSPASAKRVHFRLVPSPEFLLDDASISCGKVVPRLYLLATNHNNGSRDSDYEDTESVLVADQEASWSKSDSFGGGEGGATAALTALCTKSDSEKKHAKTELSLEGSIHAETGNGFRGTGFHPGGGAGIYPSWKSDMALPGMPGQTWNISLAVNNGLVMASGIDAPCTLTIDDPNSATLTASLGENKSASFDGIPSGKYKLSLVCAEPSRGFPFRAAQVIKLWSGQASDVTTAVKVKVRIDARRK